MRLTRLFFENLLNIHRSPMSIGDKNLAMKLHEQGQLLDVYPYLKYVPQMHTYITKDYKEYATSIKDGVMFALPRYPTFAPNWAFQIRQDWLDQFGMDMPTTESELFEFAKAAAACPMKIASGKFHGLMQTTGPSGRCVSFENSVRICAE